MLFADSKGELSFGLLTKDSKVVASKGVTERQPVQAP